jgi:flagellar hook-associated protein 3 FlgL
MRVTAATFYKDYAKTVQDLKAEYNKSMEQVSTGKKYADAYENPLDYYAGKKIDNLYNDVVVKDTMIKDVVNRLEQQESASRSFYGEMSSLNVKYEQMASSSYQGLESTVDTMHTYFLNTQQTLAQDLNATYENFYVMGGNDATTVPFTMSDDGMTLTYHHKFAGDDNATVMSMTYNPDTKEYSYSGTYYTSDDDGNVVTNTVAAGANADEQNAIVKRIVTAMREQGRMSLGYGDITNLSTLPDTYYGGLNMVTGITSDQLRAECDATDLTQNIATFKEAMNKSAFALNAQAIDATGDYLESFSGTEAEKEAANTKMNEDLAYVLGNWDNAMIDVSNTFRRIGVATSTLEDVQTRLQLAQDNYQKEYNDHLAIDTYDAVVKMYQGQFAYNAAMQVGSKIMQNSLFDFVQ